MSVETRQWRRLVEKDQWYHLARFRFLPGHLTAVHTRDFPEVFWLEHGLGRHPVKGLVKTVGAGDLVLVRASDRHRLEAVDTAGFRLGNLAYAPAVRADLRMRHGASLRPWRDPQPVLPLRIALTAAQQRELADKLGRLASITGRSRIAVERFMLGLHLLIDDQLCAMPRSLPGWLGLARERARADILRARRAGPGPRSRTKSRTRRSHGANPAGLHAERLRESRADGARRARIAARCEANCRDRGRLRDR